MTSYKFPSPLLVFSLLFVSACGGGGNGEFNPRNPYGYGPLAVSLSADGAETATPGDLGSAGNYAILAKTGISDVPTNVTRISGNIGVSPVAATYITNFSLTGLPGAFAGSTKVIGGGNVYAADYASPTPSNLTTAIGSVETAYTTAAGRNPPDHIELYAGNLTGQTLAPDLYKWGTDVLINAGNVTISGSPTDVWIFQIAGNLTMDTATQIILAGGALPENIFWVVAGQVTLEANTQFKGIILSKTAVVMKNGASLNGRIFAQTAVTLNENAITEP